jgi:hypothetical protein
MGGAGGASSAPYTTSKDECSRDHDCGTNEYCGVFMTNREPWQAGLCFQTPDPPIPDYERICSSAGSGCVTDDDCGENQVCECDSYVGNCVEIPEVSGCRTDSDCGEEALCLDGYKCQVAEDECSSSADCAEGDTCVIER